MSDDQTPAAPQGEGGEQPTQPLPSPGSEPPAQPDPQAAPRPDQYGQQYGQAAPGEAPVAYAPPASGSNRTLWIALGIGGAALAMIVLLGGLAFGLAVRHHNNDNDHGPMMGRDYQAGPPSWRGNDEGGQGQGPGQGLGQGLGGLLGGQLGPMMGGPLGEAARGGLHGQVVVPNGSNGYTTVTVQRGDVTAVSASSISVKSSDGFSAKYAVNAQTLVFGTGSAGASSGIGDVSTGDAVTVLAQGSGNSLTARVVAVQ